MKRAVIGARSCGTTSSATSNSRDLAKIGGGEEVEQDGPIGLWRSEST